MKVFNLPNTLTIGRILLIPVFVTVLGYRKYDYALYVFVFASLTDMLDGLLARIKDQRTELGQVLDPLADKFMLVTSFLIFSYYGWIPPWLTIIVISRDIIIVTGTVVLYFLTSTLRVEPSAYGKAAIALQFLLLCVVLLNINYGVLAGLRGALLVAVAILTVVSGLHYIHRGFRLAG